MNAFLEAVQRYLRGPAVSRVLRRFGIDPHRYWLLVDLFGELTDRREMLGHLGRDGIGLKMIAGIYGLFTAVRAGIQVLLAVPVGTYFATFLGITALMLLMVLLSETSNSLVNPVEGLVLAHQPINGATYTAAKLTHLLRVLAYIVPSLNLLPALAGFLLPGARWTYPLVHFFSACVLGVVIALFCCAFFGNLIRFVPPARLKTVGQIAEAAPLLFLLLAGNLSRVLKTLHVSRALSGHPAALWSLATAFGAIVVLSVESAPLLFLLLAGNLSRVLKTLHVSRALSGHPAALWSLVTAFGAIVVLSVVFGIRALSGDYLVRVSAIVHGASHAPARHPHRTPLAAAIARLAGGQAGGQPARAGFEYVRRMMVRDWQFRRQLIPMIPTAVMGLLAIFGGVRTSPFSGTFTPVHFLPHALGALLFVACTALAHGSDYKGAWIFLTVPGSTFRGFAHGVHALLWTAVILIPNLIVLGL